VPEQSTLQELSSEIQKLKKEKNAIILRHVYQRPEVEEVADFVGDSLGLSQKAAQTGAKVIVFCGVHFMAESASILSPDKTVVLPDENAGCPMADMVDAVALKRKKEELGDPIVVCYVNTSAEVKAESDIACTSANAVKVVESLPGDRPVLFIPDQNLGAYVIQKTGRDMHLWEGFCNVHDRLTAGDILRARAEHPRALVLVHPECRPEVIDLADAVASTTGMMRFARESDTRQFIVATEMGILHPLKKQNPEKDFYMASDRLVCPNMKMTTLEKVRRSLLSLEPRVSVPQNIRVKAIHCLERMLAIQ
jgi:quinolinate synthase